MPYYKVTPHTLYQSCMSSAWEWLDRNNRNNPLTHALAWVEAENIFEVWRLVQEWFELMECGEAANHYPDPYWKDGDHPDKVALTQEVADEFINEMDADFILERDRFQGRFAPEFARLPAHARMAFVQQAYKLIKSGTEIEKEARERLAAGESMPPPEKG